MNINLIITCITVVMVVALIVSGLIIHDKMDDILDHKEEIKRMELEIKAKEQQQIDDYLSKYK